MTNKHLFIIISMCFLADPLCKGSCREATEGLCASGKRSLERGNNPSVTASPCHLPLHKGGINPSRIAFALPTSLYTREALIPPASRLHCPPPFTHGRQQSFCNPTATPNTKIPLTAKRSVRGPGVQPLVGFLRAKPLGGCRAEPCVPPSIRRSFRDPT